MYLGLVCGHCEVEVGLHGPRVGRPPSRMVRGPLAGKRLACPTRRGERGAGRLGWLPLAVRFVFGSKHLLVKSVL